jgi:hypothetical protein
MSDTIALMVEALRPFATFCERYEGGARGLAREDSDTIYCFHGSKGEARITLGDVRAARDALAAMRSESIDADDDGHADRSGHVQESAGVSQSVIDDAARRSR